MGTLELAELVDEWWHARMIDMADEGDFLDGSGVSVCTQVRSHLPSMLRGGSFPQCGHVARHSSPPDAGPAA